eukprot:1156911-Pelagomonas_calceolata.AAC.7
MDNGMDARKANFCIEHSEAAALSSANTILCLGNPKRSMLTRMSRPRYYGWPIVSIHILILLTRRSTHGQMGLRHLAVSAIPHAPAFEAPVPPSKAPRAPPLTSFIAGTGSSTEAHEDPRPAHLRTSMIAVQYTQTHTHADA